MRKFIAMLLACVMVFGIVGSAVARTPEQILADVQHMNSIIDSMEQQGQISTGDVFTLTVDLGRLATDSVVTLSIYTNGNHIPDQTKTFTTSQNYTWKFAEQQLVKYGLGNIANRYQSEPFNTDITCKTYFPDKTPRYTIPFYAYGPYKLEAIAELYNGIPTCFDIVYYPPGSGGGSGYSGSMSQPVEPIETPVADAIEEGTASEVMSAIFSVGNNTVTVANKTIEMDVSPYIKNDRTYVPVRYLAYSLGVPEEGVTWDSNTKAVGIITEDTTISLTIDSTTMIANQESIQMDVAPEIKNGRTMLPARWVAEVLGATVEWDSANNKAIITITKSTPAE